MFINTIEFPAITAGKETEFLEWFKWSNSIYKNFNGFISRRLLKSNIGNGNYISLVEHESKDTFMLMHTSKERQAAFSKLKPLMEGSLIANFYDLIIDAE